MNSTLPRFTIPPICVLVSMLLLAACGGGGGKDDIAEQTWECMAKNSDPEIFEESMLVMLPTASNLEEAKEMYIYVSSAASIEELRAARDEACGEN